MLGVFYAALGALTFALNNVTMRRGVVTGSALQGMALTVPIGGLSFLVLALAFGEQRQLAAFPVTATTWLACQGIVHFVIGRYCNYKSNQLMGVNLAAPVIQLQVPVAMLLAVLLLREKFTVLQAIGSVLMLSGSFITQSESASGTHRSAAAAPRAMPGFQPRVIPGYLFGLTAALCYGGSPLMARQAFLDAPADGAVAGGCLAYLAATIFISLVLLRPRSWGDIVGMRRENLPWFFASAVFVAISQAFVYASLAVAPLMVVTPILQLSLVFRLLLSQWLNREYEVMNIAVFVGAAMAVLGSILVSIETSALATLLHLPPSLGDALDYRLAGR